MHGGDIYRNSAELDFSVNISPLGVPESGGGVKEFSSICGEISGPALRKAGEAPF